MKGLTEWKDGAGGRAREGLCTPEYVRTPHRFLHIQGSLLFMENMTQPVKTAV